MTDREHRGREWDEYEDARSYQLNPKDVDHVESVICSGCNGSGEGMYEGSRCRDCGGSGEILVEIEEEDDDE